MVQLQLQLQPRVPAHGTMAAAADPNQNSITGIRRRLRMKYARRTTGLRDALGRNTTVEIVLVVMCVADVRRLSIQYWRVPRNRLSEFPKGSLTPPSAFLTPQRFPPHRSIPEVPQRTSTLVFQLESLQPDLILVIQLESLQLDLTLPDRQTYAVPGLQVRSVTLLC